MPFSGLVPEQTASAGSSIRSASPDRPSLRGARSFSRLEPSTTNPLSRLATELTIPEVPDAVSEASSPVEEDGDDDGEKIPSSTTFPDGFDELPAELLNLTDRYIYPIPLTSREELTFRNSQLYRIIVCQNSPHPASGSAAHGTLPTILRGRISASRHAHLRFIPFTFIKETSVYPVCFKKSHPDAVTR